MNAAARLLAQNSSVRPDNVGVEFSARLDRPRLRRVIHMNDSKALRVSVTPLEVVEQRPGKVSAQRNSLTNRFVGGFQMVAEIRHTQRVDDLTVDGCRRI